MKRLLFIFLALIILPVMAIAGESEEKPFVKKRYSIQGSATVQLIDSVAQLQFSDDFKTKNGPDLKLYLSKKPLSSLTPRDVDQDAVRLSVLKSHKGSQTYVIPANIDLADYESILIQCEAYSVLWGGFDL